MRRSSSSWMRMLSVRRKFWMHSIPTYEISRKSSILWQRGCATKYSHYRWSSTTDNAPSSSSVVPRINQWITCSMASWRRTWHSANPSKSSRHSSSIGLTREVYSPSCRNSPYNAWWLSSFRGVSCCLSYLMPSIASGRKWRSNKWNCSRVVPWSRSIRSCWGSTSTPANTPWCTSRASRATIITREMCLCKVSSIMISLVHFHTFPREDSITLIKEVWERQQPKFRRSQREQTQSLNYGLLVAKFFHSFAAVGRMGKGRIDITGLPQTLSEVEIGYQVMSPILPGHCLTRTLARQTRRDGSSFLPKAYGAVREEFERAYNLISQVKFKELNEKR